MNYIKITSRQNTEVKKMRLLFRERAFRLESGLFAAEGRKLLSEAAASGLVPETILITEKAYEKQSAFFSENENIFKLSRIFFIDEGLCAHISDVKAPQGVFFSLPLIDKILNMDTIYNGGKKRKFILLDSLQDSGNVGTIIRAAEAFGIDGLFVSESACDIYSPKVIRGAMGSLFRLPVYRTDLRAAAEEFKKLGFTVYGAVLDKRACSIEKADFSGDVCVIIGNEGNGISGEVLGTLENTLYIPIKSAESLNAGVAASIIMYEMQKGIL